MQGVFRLYVEKKKGFCVEANALFADIRENLQMEGLTALHIINRYDAEGISEEIFAMARSICFFEPQVDVAYDTLPKFGEKAHVFAVEYLPGQFDQRADSCEQCIQILTRRERPKVRTAKVYVLEGFLTDADVERIKKYIINPVESREAALSEKDTLQISYEKPEKVAVLTGFTTLHPADLYRLRENLSLAMDNEDIAFCQAYFRDDEKRDPTITEIRMIDTYWSDHCRHTTFLTRIEKVSIADPAIQAAFMEYQQERETVHAGKTRNVCLMDMATIGAKALRREGLLDSLDISDEVNACTVKIKVTADGEEEDWLLLFKNETHNHPTEIEPFGGAATCLGGAIRDPLSGRAYVYQAMRVTGAADPTVPISETMEGKLPQRKIVTTAAAGYSSYGNQIGLATGLVQEIYHPGYVAKRMEDRKSTRLNSSH